MDAEHSRTPKASSTLPMFMVRAVSLLPSCSSGSRREEYMDTRSEHTLASLTASMNQNLPMLGGRTRRLNYRYIWCRKEFHFTNPTRRSLSHNMYVGIKRSEGRTYMRRKFTLVLVLAFGVIGAF